MSTEPPIVDLARRLVAAYEHDHLLDCGVMSAIAEEAKVEVVNVAHARAERAVALSRELTQAIAERDEACTEMERLDVECRGLLAKLVQAERERDALRGLAAQRFDEAEIKAALERS